MPFCIFELQFSSFGCATRMSGAGLVAARRLVNEDMPPGDEGEASRRVDEPRLSVSHGRVEACDLLERAGAMYSLDNGVEIEPGRSAGSTAFRVDSVVLTYTVVD